MHARGITDSDLLAILTTVQIESLLSTHSFDDEEDWPSVLSAGIQQRLGMARLFYHKPKYAILDECTSSQDLETEKVLYETATGLGVTLITVSHRKSLWRWHNRVLGYKQIPLLSLLW